MEVHFTDGADKHHIPREDSHYAMLHAEVSAEIDGLPGEVTKAYVGHPHAQTDDYIEVFAAHRPPRTIVIFHAMPLSDLFRDLLDEGTTFMTTSYDELSARAERGELALKPGTALRGAKAADEAQRSVLDAVGTMDLDELTHIVLGRPRVGAGSGASPVVRARVPQALKDRLTELAKREHRKESDVVRDALVAYVNQAG